MIAIRNEFAYVELERVDTANGERLRVSVPGTDLGIYLDALELHALTRLRHSDFATIVGAALPRGGLDDPPG